MVAELIGFIGLGNMGAPIARRLAEHGYRLAVHDRDQRATATFAGRDEVTVCGSAREVAALAGTVFVSLPSPEALGSVVGGADGVLAAANPATVVIDLSTSGVTAARAVSARVKAAGRGYLDAPVSGGVRGAEAGTLSVMVAGDAAVYEAHRQLLDVVGSNVFYLGGEPGQGQAMKLVNNILLATAMAVTAEAMTVAVKAGLDPVQALDILNVSTGMNTATRDKFPQAVVTRTFQYGAATHVLYKDVKLFEELAEALAVPTLVSEATVNAWRLAMIQGFGDQDFTTIARVYERWAGVEIGA